MMNMYNTLILDITTKLSVGKGQVFHGGNQGLIDRIAFCDF